MTEPIEPVRRLTTMMKGWAVLAASAAVLVAGCHDADRRGADAGATTQPTPVASPDPTASPWPAYDVEDYTYTLRVACFCADRGVPVVVTVRDGKAVAAVYAHRGRGHEAGDEAGDWMRLSIDDVVDAANDDQADLVRVRWPVGQAYPDSVYVDQSSNGADDEIGYSIRDVLPG